jgi:hypothetical protein
MYTVEPVKICSETFQQVILHILNVPKQEIFDIKVS